MPDVHPLIVWAGPESVKLLRASQRDIRAAIVIDREPVTFTIGQHAVRRAAGDPMVSFLFMAMDHFAFDGQDLPPDGKPFVSQWEAGRSPQSLLVLADWLEDRGDPLAGRLRSVVSATPRLFSSCPDCRMGEINGYPNLNTICPACNGSAWLSMTLAPLLHADLWAGR